ncbi:MAG: hypothetical protein LC637_09725 [Xanthomonadaceae bacterium]|nr:hypothetical protein [Xanthomonadaceae bacterium]
MVPAIRMVVPHWPQPIVERIFPDGTIQLAHPNRPFRDDSVPRSLPLSAARVEFSDGHWMLGYVTAIRFNGDTVLAPPGRRVWRPVVADCELAIASATGATHWSSCADVVQVLLPNQLSVLQSFKVSRERLLVRHRDAQDGAG